MLPTELYQKKFKKSFDTKSLNSGSAMLPTQLLQSKRQGTYKPTPYQEPKKIEVKLLEKQKSPIDNLLGTVKSLDFERIKTAFTSSLQSTPGTLKVAGGIIIGGLAQQQKAIDDFFSKTVPQPLRPIITPPGLQTQNELLRPVVKKAEEIAPKLRETGEKERQKAVSPYAKLGDAKGNLQKITEAIVFNLPQMALSTGLTVGTALATKNPILATTVGLSSSYGQGASEVYSEARINGLTDRQALPVSRVGGVIIGALDFVPLERLLRKTGSIEPIKRSIVKKIAKGIVNTGVQSGFEGITEGVQEIVGNAIEATYSGKKDFFKNVGLATVVGAIFGGLADVSVEGVIGLSSKGKKSQDVIENVNKKIENAIKTPASKRTDEQKEIVNNLLTNDFTPQEAGGLVLANQLENMPIGKDILKATLQAQKEGKNIRIVGSDENGDLKIELVGKSAPSIIAENIQKRNKEIPRGSEMKDGVQVEMQDEKTLREKAKKFDIDVPEKFRSEDEKKSFQQFVSNPEGMVQKYLDTFRKDENTAIHINGDNAKELFEGYNKTNVVDYDIAGGNLAKLTYRKALELVRNNSKPILFSAGGPGSGKSSVTNSIQNDFSIYFDSNLANFERSVQRIDEALATGKKVLIEYIYRNPELAYTKGVLRRYENNDPRTVPIETHIKQHIAARDTALKLYEYYKNNDDVAVEFYDNSKIGEDATPISVDFVRNIKYNVNNLRKELHEYTQKLYKERKLTKEQLEALSGGEKATQEIRRSVGSSEQKINEANQKEQVENASKEKLPTKNLITGREVKELSPSSQSKSAESTEETKKPTPQYDYQSTQLDLPVKIANKITTFAKNIPENELSIDEADSRFGIEKEPHVTVLYGLDNKITEEQLTEVLKGTPPITLELGKTSLFDTNEDYDVLKVDVKSDQLTALHEKIKKEFETPGLTFKEYNPHVTIAYMKKGKAQKYAGSTTFEGEKVTFNSLTFSKKSGEKIEIPLKKQQIIIKQQEKKVSFTSKEARVLQSVFAEKISKLRDISLSQEDLIQKGVTLIDETIEQVRGDKTTLAGIRTALNKEMFGIAGVTGSYKADYATLKTLMDDPDIGDYLSMLEDKIALVDDLLFSKDSGLQAKTKTNLQDFEVRETTKEGTEQFKIYKKIAQLTRKYAQSIGEGYLPRKSLGVFFPKTKNIRINAMTNLSTAAHEITHFLDDSLKISESVLKGDKKFLTELSRLYDQYYGGTKNASSKLKAIEGLATLLQKYVEMPTTISAEYPSLVKEFLQPKGKYYHKVIGEILTDLNDIVSEYQGLNALDKIGARVTSEGTGIDKKSFLNFFQKLRTQIADKVYPVEVIAQKAGIQETSKDPSLWIRAYNSVNGIVANNIISNRGYWVFTDTQNGFQKKYNYNWKTLISKTQKQKTTDSFAYYLVARREHFLYEELDIIKSKRDKAELISQAFNAIEAEKMKDFDRDLRASLSEDYGIDLTEFEYEKAKKRITQLLQELDKEYTSLKEVLDNDGMSRKDVDTAYEQNKELFKEEEEIFDNLVKEDLELLHNKDVQLINNETFAKLNSKKGYASFKRQFYDELVGESDIPSAVRIGSTKVSSLIRRTGSERTIINPLYSALENHSEILKKSMTQVVYNQIGDLGVSAVLPNLFQEIQLKVAIEKETGKISYPQEKDPNIIMARKDYKRVPILTNKEVKQTVDALLTYKNIDILTQLYTGLSRTFTAGTTGYYPWFAINNFLVDQITATANSYRKFIPLYSPIKQMLDNTFRKDSVEAKFYEEYLVMGGERQTLTGWQRLTPTDLFKRISNEKKLIQKMIDKGQKVTDILAWPSAKSELLSRAAEYVNARKAGKSQVAALEEAGRVTAPFHHIGAWGAKPGSEYGQTFIRGLPFFNASVQVLDQSLRVAGTKSGAIRMTFVTLAVTAAYLAAITSIMKATDDQKEQYKDLEGEEFVKSVYFPNPFSNNLLRIRMPENFSMPGLLINMIIAERIFNVRYDGKDYLNAVTAFLPNQFNPTDPTKAILGWIPQVFKPITQVIYNVKDYPNVGPLVGQGLQSRPAKLQYNEGTSAFAKKLGEILNVSPIKVDYLITGYLGRTTGFFTLKPGEFNPVKSIVREYYFTSGKRVREAYEIKEENDKIYNAYQNYEGKFANLSKSEAREVYRKKIITNEITSLLGEYRDINVKKEQEKARKLRAEILIHIENLHNGTTPKNINKWSHDAQRRRLQNKKKN
jgi:2'-5' RNA ligase